MTNLRKCRVGIRESKLSKAQTNIFIKESEKYVEIKKNIQFEVQTIKTSGDIHKETRLDTLGGKGLFTKKLRVKFCLRLLILEFIQ